MGAIYQHLSEGNTTLKIRPRLVANGVSKEFAEIQVGLVIPIPVPIELSGYFYSQINIMDARNIAPVGWSVATADDYSTLNTTIGGGHGKLKSTGTILWADPNVGATNETGMSMVSSGNWNNNSQVMYDRYTTGHLWTSTTDIIGVTIYGRKVFVYNTSNGNISASGPSARAAYSPFRIIKENSIDPGFVVGNNGYQYETVKIGDQVWAKSNSCESMYRDKSAVIYANPNNIII